MCTSAAVRKSCLKEKGSNATQSKIDACSTERKPHKLKQDEPVTPVNQTAICLKLSDDGHGRDDIAEISFVSCVPIEPAISSPLGNARDIRGDFARI